MDSLFVIEITRKCNMDCSYCYVRNKEDHNFSIERIESSILALEQHIKKSNSVRIEFIGGEPLLNIEGLKYAINRLTQIRTDIVFSMVSNGTIYTEEIVEILNNNNFVFYISLDGIKFVHNANRVFKSSHKGTFDIVEQNVVKYIKSLKKDICLSLTLNNQNIPYFYKSICYLHTIGVRGINLGIVQDQINDYNFKILTREVNKFFSDKILSCEMNIPEIQKPDMALYFENEVDYNKGIEFKVVKALEELNEQEKNKAKKHFFFMDVSNAAKEVSNETKRI